MYVITTTTTTTTTTTNDNNNNNNCYIALYPVTNYEVAELYNINNSNKIMTFSMKLLNINNLKKRKDKYCKYLQQLALKYSTPNNPEHNYVRARARAQKYTHTRACAHARTYARTRTHARAHTHTHTHTRTHERTHARSHARTHTHTHTYTLARTHARTHTHTHTHTQSVYNTYLTWFCITVKITLSLYPAVRREKFPNSSTITTVRTESEFIR